MTHLTVSIDAHILRQARLRAITEGTSVSAKVGEFLARYARDENGGTAAGPDRAVKLPVYRGATGLRPGLDPLSNKSLRAAAKDSG